MELSKPIEPYVTYEVGRVAQPTHIVIGENPDQLMEILEDFCTSKEEDEEVKIEVDENAYKAKIEFAKNDLKIGVKIFRMGEEDLFCVDLVRKSGDLIEFLNLYKEIDLYIRKKYGYEEEEEQQ
jgi:hypothetical protein